jgi:hypothetical protein
MKAHLKDHFLREATHHIAKAKHHRAIAGQAGKFLEMHKAAKSDMEGLDQLLESFIEEHSAIANEHADYAAHCTECAKAFSASGKAAGGVDHDLYALAPLPAGVSVIPQKDAPLVRAVLRSGMQALPTPEENPLFAKVFGTDEAE